ncbi:hypothetical protein HUT19_13730 [Streptomyces sp. NA02950]|uniref:hypothetical protein n=1 Tax=Streptomyces sp. NA02950 TaxID=2742137 RepID=UPI00159063B9|nr:hypothetical protein [Streptomyces sp. NA02950]QKV92678.1 hypothetical protein HUT19_13730 [Streptomyces sp. NA02950]
MDQKTSEPVQSDTLTLVCARCGAHADGAPLTWTCSLENGARRYFCDDCARADLREIEGRLDFPWW